MFGQIELDQQSWRRFQRAVRRSVDRDLPKRLGQANKSIGAMVIAKLSPRPDPAAVGLGRGAAVRPSASKREVVLRVGGAHRVNPSLPKPTSSNNRWALAVWGKRQGPLAFRKRPPRPHIRQTVEDHRDEIEQAWLKAVADAMKPAFHKTTP